MSRKYRYQEQYAGTLAKMWNEGKREYVRTAIRTLKNKAQASYIAATVAWLLEQEAGAAFCMFLHPNEGNSGI